MSQWKELGLIKLVFMMSGIPTPPPLAPLLTNKDSAVRSHTEEYKVCLSSFENYKQKYITSVEHVAQNGPNCGLAALAMVSNLTPKVCSMDEIMQEAKSRGFTYNGEMFSVLNMKLLCEAVLKSWFTIEMFTDGLANNKSLVIERLYDGWLMLIPYDADKNHSPCCRQGHKAHWALVCGVMKSITGNVYVVARHGKSRHLAAWSLDSLQLSNDNLSEMDPEKQNDDKQYLVPMGGVREGLASKFILLKKNEC